MLGGTAFQSRRLKGIARSKLLGRPRHDRGRLIAPKSYKSLGASPRDAARLRGVLRVLREWDLARSAPASPLARVCALHLLCRDAGFLHDARMMVLACVLGGGACRYGCARALRARSTPQGCSLHALLHNTGSDMTPNDLCHATGS